MKSLKKVILIRFVGMLLALSSFSAVAHPVINKDGIVVSSSPGGHRFQK